MNALARALSAETLKTRRTLALAMTFLAPLVIAVFMFGMYLQRMDYYVAQGTDSPWPGLFRNVLVFWSILMLPLFITLETALLSGLDHNGRHWTLLYTMPVSRGAMYAAKALVGWASMFCSTIFMLGLMLLVAGVLQMIQPRFGFNAPIPWTFILKYSLLTHLASWLMIGLHLWISMHWHSFVVASGSGIAATVGAVFLIGRDAAMFYPWTMPAYIAAMMEDGTGQTVALALGMGGGLLLALLGGWEVCRRDAM